jgi:hypothetical protein
MLKALRELNGFSIEEVGKMASDILERGLKQQIMEEIGEQEEGYGRGNPSFAQMMSSSIAEGLGDNTSEEDEEERERPVVPVQLPREMMESPPKRTYNPMHVPPVSRGITDDMLERDLSVEDPRHEAAAEAAPSDSFLFEGEYSDPRVQKRRRPMPKTRAKVTPYSGEDSHENPMY